MTDSNEPLMEDPRPAELATIESLVVLHTGDGKGKTTAALGTAVRAAGHGWNVVFLQFMKSADWLTGEAKSCRDLEIHFECLGDGFTWDSADIDADIARAKDAWNKAASLITSGEYKLVVLDELTYLCSWGWVDVEEVVRVISDRPVHVCVVITGRDALPQLISLADTASNSVSLHHAYDRGIAALKGIDF
jgi:cob(I)alamin adenosyltransferase